MSTAMSSMVFCWLTCKIYFIKLCLFACIKSFNIILSAISEPNYFELCWLHTTTNTKRTDGILRNATFSHRNTWYNSQSCTTVVVRNLSHTLRWWNHYWFRLTMYLPYVLIMVAVSPINKPSKCRENSHVTALRSTYTYLYRFTISCLQRYYNNRVWGAEMPMKISLEARVITCKHWPFIFRI